MKKIHNLNDYKKAKVVVNELNYLLEEIKNLEIKLFKYVKYNRVKEIISLLDDTKRDFNRHVKLNEEKIKKKGS